MKTGKNFQIDFLKMVKMQIGAGPFGSEPSWMCEQHKFIILNAYRYVVCNKVFDCKNSNNAYVILKIF